MDNILVKRYVHTSYDNWPGKITSLIYLGGCNFRCPFCNTPELVKNHQAVPNLNFSDVISHLTNRKNWIDAVVITGGEPSLHKADVIEMLNELKAEGFKTKVETNGFDLEFITELNKLQLVDLWSIDIKASLDMYKKATDIDVKAETMRRTIKAVIESGVNHEFKTVAVPGLHDKFQIFKLAQELQGAQKYIIHNFDPSSTLDPHYMIIKPFTEKQIAALAEQARQFIKDVEIR